MKVEIIVLNYNGGDLLLECLPSLIASAKNSKHEAKVILLDNGSRDQSDQETRERFPSVSVIHSTENKVLCSYNDYLEKADCDVAVLMNNDIRVEENFLDPLIVHFVTDSDVFMVTPKCLSYDGTRFEGGITRFRMKYGIFWASSRYDGHEQDIRHVHPTMSAGYGAFDRKKFLELGGYDELYLPGRLEDSDLCFRAWKRGWNLLYDPKSVVYHKGAVSFNKRFGESGTLKINHRNSFLFVWKNIQDPGYLVAHIILLPFRLLYALIRGQREFSAGFMEALPLLGLASKKRKTVGRSKLSDRDIFLKV